MKQSNLDKAHKAIQEYRKQYYKEAYDLAVKAAEDTLLRAFRNRNDNKTAHNYTGNLINSIAAVVLVPPDISRIGNIPQRTPIFFRDINIALESPFYKPMSKVHALTYKYTGSRPDYDYVATDENPVTYKPEKNAASTQGPTMAENWVSSVKLDRTTVNRGQECYVQVHVGYTMEYAQFVEKQHQTTGAYRTHREAGQIFYHYIM